jgi:hypothetical protein
MARRPAATGGLMSGTPVFDFVVEATSYATAWLVSGFTALLAATVILLGRHLLPQDRAAAKAKRSWSSTLRLRSLTGAQVRLGTATG